MKDKVIHMATLTQAVTDFTLCDPLKLVASHLDHVQTCVSEARAYLASKRMSTRTKVICHKQTQETF